jgi:hypothetical protein
MNLYAYLRKFVAGILGVFWGYRVAIAINQEGGLSLAQYVPTFIATMVFLSVLVYLIHKEKKTFNPKIFWREVWEDVLFAILFNFVELLAPNIFGFILPSA